jgi:siroheme synthase-like protein
MEGEVMRNESVTHPILPVCLMLAGKPCLVVGGGPIAARKAGHLLEAEANVTVVTTEAGMDIQTLASTGKVRLVKHPFIESDLDAQCLVFAATDNEDVNRQVIDACQRRGILCSAADSNWPRGDFVMPATCRQNGMVVTVSTGGRSCRQARLVKDKIAGLLSTLANESTKDNTHDDGHDDP